MITIGQVKRLRFKQPIYAKGEYGSDGRAVRWVVNGVPQLWKTRPNDFSIPVKHGMYDFGHITQLNAHRFTLKEPAPRRPVRKKLARRLSKR